ncbi:DUF1987 domain-containing protein [Aurantibacillus circumpalustris]|uniref:DUF1987 domain-containing protein n=1 Tax=Aurantibacillus circumpalustris TaxID=3036359 RepID=UPI00295BBC67|nr:DUF1987 domain-containing protein [Aurantibacillus circumpalustris]
MQLLNITATEDTPEITFNGETNEFIISGRSLPEDVTTFYKPVFEWLEAFSEETTPTTSFKFKLEYFNTASSKIILDILMKLEDMMESKNSQINIEWYYFESDDDMLEAGEEYKELVEIPFNLIAC